MIYDFNLNNAAIQNLPPDKRQPRIILLLQALLSPLQYARDAFFGTYYTNDLSKRILYTGQRLVLEYALNTRFGGTFRQPYTAYEASRVSPHLPDIYTSKLSSVDCSFLIGLTEPHCSTIGLTEDYGNSFQLNYQDAIGVFKDWIYVNNFTINIPTALYNAIPGATTYTTTDPLRNLIINKFVNTYIPIGMHFTITLI
jgi:hypothetical protein